MTAAADVRTLLEQVQGQEAWAVIRRKAASTAGIIGGTRSEVDSILDIPLEEGIPEAGRSADRLVAVPFRQIAERGFDVIDDGTPLVRCAISTLIRCGPCSRRSAGWVVHVPVVSGLRYGEGSTRPPTRVSPMTAAADVRALLEQVQGQQAWAVIRRKAAPTAGIIGGTRSEVDSILDIPLEDGIPEPGRSADRLVAVPFRQIAERGFDVIDDGTPWSSSTSPRSTRSGSTT